MCLNDSLHAYNVVTTFVNAESAVCPCGNSCVNKIKDFEVAISRKRIRAYCRITLFILFAILKDCL